jgi:ceramide glucosyltransferase
VIALLAALAMLLAGFGCLYQVAAAWAVRAHVRKRPPSGGLAPVTVLKPLCGAEPGLGENLATFCRQDHPDYQVIFGVREADDPAIPVVRKLIADLGRDDVELVVDGDVRGTNYKVSNLGNMMARARHGVIVIADSDMRVAPHYLRAVTAPLEDPGVGLVTCLYVGRPRPGLWSRLGAAFINWGFLPSALVGQALGVDEGCFGATMALRRETLERVGGFAAFDDHLADDHALGAAVRRLGLKVALSPYLVEDDLHEPSLAALYAHELRWQRTIRVVAPGGHAGSVLTQPLAFAALGLVLALFSAGAVIWSAIAVLCVALAARIFCARVADSTLGVPLGAWLVPLRDALSLAVFVHSFLGRRVRWRGHLFKVAADGRLVP